LAGANTIRPVRSDLVLSPFGAQAGDLVAVARLADAGFDGVYTYDHFSGVVADRPWSREPFSLLGAIAATTTRVRLGVLVANMVNRHPAQLASALNTLQSLAPGRVMCGVGAGAAPGSKFAAEHELIGRVLADSAARRAALVTTIESLRDIWAGSLVPAVTDGTPAPPIIVGASSRATVELAARVADGVNIQRCEPAELRWRVERARQLAGGRPFEVSVFDALDPDHPLGGDAAPLAELGVDRRTLHVAPPFPADAIARIAAAL
jgi:alkanesulfonate monooxygenase SsuD/methylene tetrahydromethanopterin reductase-like flavin-dependent oxidoreductase (luciferase family)